MAFSRRPGGKLNGAEPNGSASGCGEIGATLEVTAAAAAAGTEGGGAAAAVAAVAIAVAAFCSVGVSVDVVEADLAVMPAKVREFHVRYNNQNSFILLYSLPWLPRCRILSNSASKM